MRKIIAALVVSLDGFIEGPNGELDWVESWEDQFDLLPQIDTCILGRAMYPGYEQYWSAVLANPQGILPFTGKVAAKGEIRLRELRREDAPHCAIQDVGQGRLEEHADRSRCRRNRQDKLQPGKDVYAVGGAMLVSSLMNRGLIDELRLLVQPIVLGQRKGAVQGREGAACVEAR